MQLNTGLTAFFLLHIFTLVRASLNLSQIQTLVGFPQKCTNAYNTPINDCNDAHFDTGPLCSCSSACSSALDSMTNTIINACQGTTPSQDSLLGLFFGHAATTFLCTPPANGGGGGCGTEAAGSGSVSDSAPSSSSQIGTSVASSTMVGTSQPNLSTATTQTSSSTLSGDSATSMAPSTSLTSASTRSTTSIDSSSPPKQTTGGGSPFDISSSPGTRIDFPRQTSALLLLFVCAIRLTLL